MPLSGIFAPIPTPFTAAGELDLAALASNVAALVDSGLDGIVVLGSNGEAPLLDAGEAARAIAEARRVVPRGKLIAGTGRESTRATIEATREAADLGVDAALIRTPSFYKSRLDADALVRHFEAVADRSPIPILLYNVPALTGVNLPIDAVVRLSRHPNVAGMKDSSGDLGQLGDEIARTPDRFAVFSGVAPLLYPSLCLGVSGAIVAAACVLPRAVLRLYEQTLRGEHAEARALQQDLVPIARAITIGHGVPGLKAAMEMVGLAGGAPRLPLVPVADAVRAAIAEHLARFGERRPDLDPRPKFAV